MTFKAFQRPKCSCKTINFDFQVQGRSRFVRIRGNFLSSLNCKSVVCTKFQICLDMIWISFYDILPLWIRLQVALENYTNTVYSEDFDNFLDFPVCTNMCFNVQVRILTNQHQRSFHNKSRPHPSFQWNNLCIHPSWQLSDGSFQARWVREKIDKQFSFHQLQVIRAEDLETKKWAVKIGGRT